MISSMVEWLRQTARDREVLGSIPVSRKLFSVCSMDAMINAPMTRLDLEETQKSDG